MTAKPTVLNNFERLQLKELCHNNTTTTITPSHFPFFTQQLQGALAQLEAQERRFVSQRVA